MEIYIILFVFLLIAFLCRKNQRLSGIVIILMFLVSFFRGERVGLDTRGYSHPSFGVESFSGTRLFEVFYHYIAINFVPYVQHSVIFIFSIITFVFLYLSARRFKVDPIIVFLFFFIFGFYDLSLNICRQFAAASVLLYSYSFISEKGKKSLYFFPLVFFSASIHSSSLVMLIFYPLKYVDISKINRYVFAIICIVILYFGMTNLNSEFMKWAVAFNIGDEMESYAYYFQETDLIDRSGIGLVVSILCMLLKFFVLYRVLYFYDYKQERIKVVPTLFFISILLSILFSSLYGNLGRLRYSVSVIDCIALAYFIQLERKSFLKNVVVFSILLFNGIILYRNLANNSYGTVPYEMMNIFDF